MEVKLTPASGSFASASAGCLRSACLGQFRFVPIGTAQGPHCCPHMTLRVIHPLFQRKVGQDADRLCQ
jgi:hypothetical protein